MTVLGTALVTLNNVMWFFIGVLFARHRIQRQQERDRALWKDPQ